jgi:signal transduction histidine kinase/CheY-like chemotaxis protein
MTADAAAGSGGAPAGALRRFEPEPGLCETDVITARQPVFVKSWDESQERYWRSASAAADAAYSSSAALPLILSGAVAGVLRFDFSVPVNFDDDYRALLVSVAQHCSQALDRARLYEAAQHARTEAEAASRLKDDFLSIVSHELRTPLNAVLGWASMLRKNGIGTPLAQRAVQAIHDNATRQAQLIDDLLDVSRISAGRTTLDRQQVDLAELVNGVVESLLPAAASSSIELRLSPMTPAFVTGDRRRLEQVFFNVLGNALKFTPAGGTIALDARCAGDAVEVKVTDNGVGIAPEFLPYVFDRFRQADSTSTRSYGGLGLGLSIAKQLVEAHRGTISVTSDGQGRGTSFTVRLPLTEEARHAREPRPDAGVRRVAAEAPRLGGMRVLIVDDEADTREVMAVALSHHGADVTTAATAPEAFDLLVSRPFDVLLADIAMPGEDGCSLIRRIRACPHLAVARIPAAAVTAHARDDERRGVLDAGFHAHLVKPIEPVDLVRAVSELGGHAGLALSAI